MSEIPDPGPVPREEDISDTGGASQPSPGDVSSPDVSSQDYASGQGHASSRVDIVPASQAGRLALQSWLASRLVLLITALVVAWQKDAGLGEVLARWDVGHFIDVAEHGYSTMTVTAFFPGLPMLMAGFSLAGIPPVASGFVISLISSGMAAWGLYRLAGGGTKGMVAVTAWSFAPMAVFTFVPYTEAIFCAFAFWAFYYGRRGQWAQAAGLAACACAFRVSGLFLIGALGLLALFPLRRLTPVPWKQRFLNLCWLWIPAAVIRCYALYLRIQFGSWTIWFQAQVAGWNRDFHWPWDALMETMKVAGLLGPSGYSEAVMFRWEIAAFFIGIGLTIICLLRNRIAEAGWVGVQVLAMSFQVWLISLARTMVDWFPLYTLIGEAGVAPANHIIRRRVILLAVLALEVTAMVWWAARFFTGAWAG